MAGNPDEKEKLYIEIEGEETPDIEVQDDTPVADRGRTPLPKAIVDELEADELEDYSEKVKIRLKQMKKVWHDERREKEQARREQQESISFAQRLLDENKRLKSTLSEGEKTLVGSYKSTAELEMVAARRAYKEAYEAGDADKVVEAQEKLATAGYRLEQIKNYRPTVQPTETDVQVPQTTAQPVRLDHKTAAWQERNPWWGTDEEMTSLALGYHQKLEKQYGKDFVGTDEYWQSVDNTMRRRFPEYFGDNEKTTSGSGKTVSRTETKPATVVAPASRSTSSKKIVLKQSQLNIAKRLGLTPEQYAREYQKTMES